MSQHHGQQYEELSSPERVGEHLVEETRTSQRMAARGGFPSANNVNIDTGPSMNDAAAPSRNGQGQQDTQNSMNPSLSPASAAGQ